MDNRRSAVQLFCIGEDLLIIASCCGNSVRCVFLGGDLLLLNLTSSHTKGQESSVALISLPVAERGQEAQEANISELPLPRPPFAAF